jgi:hypothetical protein
MPRTTKKKLDAVAMMRQIRDELSRKLMTMSHEEQQRYIQERLAGKITHDEPKPRRRSSV